jgi:hypothetical protein
LLDTHARPFIIILDDPVCLTAAPKGLRMKRPVPEPPPRILSLQEMEALRERVRGTIRTSRWVTELANKTIEESRRRGGIEPLRFLENSSNLH